ncbi:MAG TPA: PINc/VapC family ATPase [Candidatus Thermoplasmatota archaeon]|nr:PINc/VapC family ATPase [Candidatus Thermoplasmatota archaeon]
MPPAKKAPRAPRVIVPDTSVLVDGRLTSRIQRGDLTDCRIVIPNAAIAELEHQANRGRESGFAGLDEVVKIQELKDAARIEVEFAGDRPHPEDIEMAAAGEIDAIIRDVAQKHKARLLTSDRVLAHVARAIGVDVEWIRPVTEPDEVEKDIGSLGIMRYFDEGTMSVHLKQNVVPMAKKGTPGNRKLVRLGEKPLELRELTRMRREIIEAAKRDADSFIEIERHGATVVQLGPMRIAIAQPPFSDAVEITAVRPVAHLSIEQYRLAPELQARLEDYQRGVFVSGPPGSGKSTFVTAIAEYLKGKDAIVKTMESPRDLQVSDEITQYAPLEKDMELTSDVLLLVRPDFVIYDEVRKTSDFEIFADMRLAGVGLIGVTHANRAIDAVQRLIGRVELGMIPQVVDTVIHIMNGKVQQVLELAFTVKVPAGMVEADLARPVITVRDFLTKRTEFEIYTYGEQVVVMPVEGAGGGQKTSARDRLAGDQLKHALRRHIDAPFEIEMSGGDAATLYAPENAIPMIIGKGGANVKHLQEVTGVRLDVKPMRSKAGWAPMGGGRSPKQFGTPRSDSEGKAEPRFGREGRFDPNRPLRRELGDVPGDDDADEAEDEGEPRNGGGRAERRFAELVPELRKSKKNIVLLVDKGLSGQDAEVVVEDETVLRATVGRKGDLRISRGSDAGERILDALARGEVVRVRV